MRFLITIPSGLIPKVSTWLLKLGIELEAVPEVPSTPAANPKTGRKSTGLPKGIRNFKCHGTDCGSLWTGPSTGTEKARWANSGLLCNSCVVAGNTTTAKDTTIAMILSEVEADLGESLSNDIEWAEDDLPVSK